MRLPQRTPWASLQELDQLCSWVYADPADSSAKSLAVQRLSAWRVITALPHALESLSSLLVAVLEDESRSPSTPALSLRQSYAAAIIRLINGFVDPLQVGVYARSIASIAAQLGLPSWLVELRHAATHEDLPSLELLRDAARESLDWLLHNYFLPLLNPASAQSHIPAPLRPLAPLLAQYKHLAKVVSRDTSLTSRYQPDIDRTLRDIERWIAEAAVAAHSTDDVERTAFSLDRLTDELLHRGALVPLSRKKRVIPSGQVLLPAPLLAIWAPLLTHIQTHHASFGTALVTRAIARLLSSSSEDGQEKGSEHERASYDLCVAGWVMWLVGADAALREEAFVRLAGGLRPGQEDEDRSFRTAHALLAALSTSDHRLVSASNAIIVVGKDPQSATPAWEDRHMAVMEARLQSVLGNDAEAGESGTQIQEEARKMFDGRLPRGWRLVGSESAWKPCPIGVYLPA
ncbi:Las1-like-domain-containing protein [Vararia minispora EC-137]|uniref:Las1-like-domain-containing protein n=1 Tax=Vararia minispora EC-137 TaxID=1314806 RepID=A0ACB8Q8Z9_9AGAM|nr:Las1-like-domain-containing protein [Vararia minispora EC-137]